MTDLLASIDTSRPLVERARQLAHVLHAEQKYGRDPYVRHLERVVAILQRHGFGGDAGVLAAAWLHDAKEDQGATDELLVRVCDIDVAGIVERVTDVDAPHLVERADIKAATYPKIAESPRAIAVKLADRIDNVGQSLLRDRTKLLATYAGEHPAFEEALQGHPMHETLWAELDALIAGAHARLSA